MWSSFDINVFSKTEDGWFEVDINTDKLYTALEKFRYLANDMPGCYVPEDSIFDTALIDNIATKFTGGTLVFTGKQT